MPDAVNVGVNATSVEQSTLQTPYSKVIINVENANDGTVQSYVAGNDTGLTLEFTNPWGTQAMANNVLARIKGKTYQPYTVTGGIIDPSAELGDGVTTNGVYGGLYTQDSYFGHQFMSDYSAPQDEEIDNEFKFESPTERKIVRQLSTVQSEFSIMSNEISGKVEDHGGNTSFGWYLKSDKFLLRCNGVDVFKCDSNGVSIEGKITATSGYIGNKSSGFTISNTYFSNGKTAFDDAKNGVYVGTNGIALGKNNAFSVDSSGNLTAKSGEFTGTITAKEGRIGANTNGEGGFVIKANKFYSANKTGYSSATEGVYIGTDGIGLGAGAFYVTKAGKLTATSGTFKGTIYASKLSFTNPNDSTKTVTISGSHLTGGSVGNSQLGGGSVSTAKIQGGAVTKAKTDHSSEIEHGETAYNQVVDLQAQTAKIERITAKKIVGTVSINTATLNTSYLSVGGRSLGAYKVTTTSGTTINVYGYP